jgi:flagellar hook assembly protein FlgD
VRLRIFDVNGRPVRVLQDGLISVAGRHTAGWNGRDDRGEAVASGVYFYRIEAGEWTTTRPMVLMK